MHLGKYIWLFFVIASCFIFEGVQGQYVHRGYSARIFKIQDGLPSNTINQIGFNQSNQLLIATPRGLVSYDGYEFLHQDSIKRAVESMAIDGHDVYLHESATGISVWNSLRPNQKRYIVTSVPTDDDPNNDHFDHIMLDSKGNIWCSDFNHIKYLHPKTGQWKQLTVAPGRKTLLPAFSLAENKTQTYILTRLGIWKYEEGGFSTVRSLFDPLDSIRTGTALDHDNYALIDQTGTLRIADFATETLRSVSSNPDWEKARKLIGAKGKLWILCENALYALALENNKVELIYQNEQRTLNDVYLDLVTEILWLATDDGLLQLTPATKQFTTFMLPGQGNAPVLDMQQLDDKWYVLSDNKIYCYHSGELLKTIALPQSQTLARSLAVIDRKIWVAMGNRVFTIDRGQLSEQDIPGMPSDASFKKIIATSFGEIWLLQESQPIIRVDKNSLRIVATTFRNDTAFWTSNKWNDIEDHQGKIWLVGWMPKSFGICYYDPADNSFVDLAQQGLSDKGLFVGDYYLSIGTTAKGDLLMSAFGGWNQLKRNGVVTRRIDIHQYPIYSEIVSGIAGTSNQQIYFGTSEGLYLYKPQEDQMYSFTEKEGLPSNNLTNGFTLLDDKFLAVGIRNGFVMVDLELLGSTKLLNRLACSEIRIDGRLQSPNETIEFKPDNNVLDVRFSALTYQQQNLIRYRYRFSDDQEWIYIHDAILSLTHLPYGQYVIEIQAGDHLDNWQRQTLSLHIKAVPPFLKSSLFYALLTLLSVSLTVLTARFFIRKAKKDNQLQERIVRSEMKALRSQMNPHFLFNSLNAIHSSIIQQKTEQASEYLGTFSRLLRHILEYTQQEHISLKQELNALRLYLQLESARLEHLFDYNIELAEDIDEEETFLPPMIIQPFVENAIWHGIRNISYQGHISVLVTQPEEGWIKISVIDNGVGRSHAKAAGAKSVSRRHLGISLSEERLKLINGRNYIKIFDLNPEDRTGTIVEIYFLNLTN